MPRIQPISEQTTVTGSRSIIDSRGTSSTSGASSKPVRRAPPGASLPKAFLTALSSSANPAVFGQSVTLRAMVTPAAPGAGQPGGTVTFFDGATSLGSATLDAAGQASISTAAVPVGSHAITAEYSGDTNFNGSTSAPLTLTVNKAATTISLSSSAATSAFGEAVTFTAMVAVTAPGAG